MRIIFVNMHTGSRTLPLASACLASALESRFTTTVDCPILELRPDFPLEDSARDILTQNPDIIALTLYTWSRTRLLALAEVCRTLSSSGQRPIILAGGPECTADAGSIQAHSAVDLAVSGEGESALVSIVETLLSSAPEYHPEALMGFPAPFALPSAADLDSLPSPWDARSLAGLQWEDTVWELTRGCPFACHFCFESKGEGRVRHKSISRAASELRQLKERGTSRVFLLDPTFNAPPERAKELLRLFITEAPDFDWHLEIRSEFLDEEQAELFAELGCTLQIGLQTAAPEIARGIGRPFSPEDFSKKVLLLHEYGVPYGLDLIYGLPGDSFPGFRDSLDFALSCAPNHIDIFPLAVLPGTRLRDRVGELNLNFISAPPYTVSGDRDFPATDLEKAAELARTANGLYNAGRAVPWFLTVCEALEIGPVQLLEAAAADSDDPAGLRAEFPESSRPGRIGGFLRRLADSAGREDIGPVLGDLGALFSLESGFREGQELPGTASFDYKPEELMHHLEMGISDPEELAAFVARVSESGGYYRILSTPEGLEFIEEEK